MLAFVRALSISFFTEAPQLQEAKRNLDLELEAADVLVAYLFATVIPGDKKTYLPLKNCMLVCDETKRGVRHVDFMQQVTRFVEGVPNGPDGELMRSKWTRFKEYLEGLPYTKKKNLKRQLLNRLSSRCILGRKE